MSDLVLRKPPFRFDGVPFMWNPKNPQFSLMMNLISFQVIGFERYVCRTMKDAEKQISDPVALAEVRTFNAQEMAHSQAHMRHVKAMLELYPGLKPALDRSIADFDAIYERNDLKYNLAYAANIEATFTPMFGAIIEHRDALFDGGDPRVSSLMLWHFCEEIEHRSSALFIYNHLFGDSWFRFRNAKSMFKHIAANSLELRAAVRQEIPDLDQQSTRGGLKAMPLGARIRMTLGILESQLPWHKPERARVPKYYDEWRRRYEAGEDMTLAYPA